MQPMASKAIRDAASLAFYAMLLAGGAGLVHADNIQSEFKAYQTGEPAVELPCENKLPIRSAVLMGGGPDVTEAYKWLIGKIDQCGATKLGKFGNVVVIRARGNSDYDPFIYELGSVAAVQTLVVPTREAANDPALADYIERAAAVWIAGGEQGDYYKLWKGTLLERLVHAQIKNRGIPVGGTSAGMMILSEFNYLADPSTVTSSEALENPYSKNQMRLVRDFWIDNDAPDEPTPFPLLRATVTDSHFDTRDRMGRLVVFLARVIEDGWAKPTEARAIGVDRQTALLLEYDEVKTRPLTYIPKILSNPGVSGSAYILSASKTSKLDVSASNFTFTDVAVTKISEKSTVNYQLDVSNGVLKPIRIDGSIY